jgi:hypothetical protein
MAKKFGSFVFVAALTGAVAGVISYLYKYQKFSEAVDKDFTDVVDSAQEVKATAQRSYTVLKNSVTREDLKAAAKDLGYAAKNLAIDTKNLAVDAGKDAYRVVKNAWDKKEKLSFSSDEVAVDEEDVDVEFYYEPEAEKNTAHNEDFRYSQDDFENEGLVVKEEF